MKNIKSRNFKRSPIALAVALTLTVPLSINQVIAGAGWGDHSNMVSKVPTYHANSPSGLHDATSCFTAAGAATVPALGGACDSGTALRKFVNNLPLPEVSGLANTHPIGVAGDLGAGYIPIARADKWVNGQGLTTNDDYYEIAAIEYSERKHSDLPATGTRLRMYVQLETAANAATSRHIALMYPDGTPILNGAGAQVFAYDTPHSLGPIINATKGIATRIKFTNYLPFGAMKGAKHFLPVDTTIQGAGIGPDGMTPFTENRIAVHLHGGDGPWVSAGSAHQWFAPAGETAAYALGMGKGQSAANVPDMADPGPGSYNLYYPNNQNGRLMWYHDQASGITRLNVYAGLTAGYKLSDATETSLLLSGVLPGHPVAAAITPSNPTGLVADDIPVIIQDVTFVPKDIAIQDANWNFDALTNAPVPAGQEPWGQYGDLWFPHVYEINQDPNSPSGWTPVGRWDWGPWFWPVFPAQYSVPSGLVNDAAWVPTSYLDSMMVNGVVYPTLTVEPKPYRMRFMNISNDRFINLGFYLADVTSPAALAAAAATGVLGSDPAMVPFTDGLKRTDGSPIVFPGWWGLVTSTMSHPAGVPDPQTLGPDIIQIGNEGGFLPQAVVLPSTITNFEWNRRSVSVTNIQEHGVLLGGGEVSDTVVDFTNFAGKTLILYNDAPNMVPAGDPRNDYYTGDPDYTGRGGAASTKPGYGPNTRTVMRVVVTNPATPPATNWAPNGAGLTNLIAKLPTAYAASGQKPPIVPSLAYNQAFGTTNIDSFLKIGSGSSKQPDLILAPPGNVTITGITLADSGGWYTSMPRVVFTPPGGATGSGAAAVVGGSLGGITLFDTNQTAINPATGAFPGEGYTSAPAVVFSGGTYPGDVPIPSTVPAAGVPSQWLPQTPAELAKYGPLPTATAVVSPAVDAAPSLSNRGRATIAIPGMQELLISPGVAWRLSVPRLGWNAPVYQPPGSPALAPVTITFAGNPNAVPPTPLTYTVTGAVTGNVVGQAFVSPAKITVNGYDVEIVGAGALAPVAGDVFTLHPARLAGTLAGVVLTTLATPNVVAYVPGTFATMPTVTMVGGGAGPTFKPAVAKAMSSGRLNWIGLTAPPAGTPIVPYSAIPLVSFVGGGGVGATAQVHVANPVSYPIRNKGVQELYEFTYGRLNAGFSVELPFTTVAIQTTVPVAYIDPVSETLNDGEVQIWKITHNGLYTHPIYFNHLDVQLINRVGWDGTIKPPFPDELGWKDTIRSNQLEDIYVAVRPKAQPNAGFGMPESVRNWDPAQPLSGVGSGMGFTQASLIGSPIASDPNYNRLFGTVAPAPVNQNTLCSDLITDYLPTAAGGTGATKHTCLDNEFTWYDGMLGWSEQDFMRPVAFHPFVMDTNPLSVNYGKWITPPGATTPGVLAAPLAPTLLSVASGATGNTLTWADNSTNEYRFDILRGTALGGPFTPLAVPALANATTYVDTTAVAGTAYWYQVQAVGAKMDLIAGVANPAYSTSAAVAVTAPVAAPATPTTLTVSLITRTSLRLSWTAPAAGSVTGYNVYQDGVLVPAANLVFGVALNNVVVSGLTAGTTYQFAIQAKNGTAISAITAPVSGTTAAPLAAPGTPSVGVIPAGQPNAGLTTMTGTGFTLQWPTVVTSTHYVIYRSDIVDPLLPNDPVTGQMVGQVVPAIGNNANVPQTLAITGLTSGVTYNFSVKARIVNGATTTDSAVSARLNVLTTPGVSFTFGAVTDTTMTVNWPSVTGATDYWVYVNGQPWNYVGPGFTPGSGNLVAAGANQSTLLTGLTPNTTYQLTLMWGTPAGNSAQSVATPATTLPAAPAAPTATSNSTVATISWAAVAGATSYTLYDAGVPVYTGPLLTAALPTAAGSLHSYTLAYSLGATTSGQSAALSVLTPLAVPVASLVTSSGLTLNWAAGGAGVTGYTVYQNGNVLATVAGTTLPITGLTAGASYSYAVVATTGTVVSAKSAVLPVITPMAAPVVSNPTTTSLTLSWAAAAGATRYTVYQTVNGVTTQLPAVVGTATTRNITGLTPGVPYSFTVAYTTATVPLSPLSAPVSSGVLAPLPLVAPTALAVSNSNVTLYWVPQATSVAPNYFIVKNNGVEIARPAAGATSYTVTGLASSTSYNFTVAYNVTYPGAAPLTVADSPVLTVKTAAAPVAMPAIPATPATPAATLIAATGFTLSWAAVPGATGYTVYQNGVALPAVAGAAVTRAITGLTAGTAYTYTVAASNAGGASAQSPGLPVTTAAVPLTQSGVAAPVPTAVKGAVGSGMLTLNWIAPAVNGLPVATSYVVYQNGVMLPLVAGVGTSRVITGLTPGVSYNFRVAYRNAVNQLTAPSAVLTVKAP